MEPEVDKSRVRERVGRVDAEQATLLELPICWIAFQVLRKVLYVIHIPFFFWWLLIDINTRLLFIVQLYKSFDLSPSLSLLSIILSIQSTNTTISTLSTTFTHPHTQ
jgi:hypothetical protein